MAVLGKHRHGAGSARGGCGTRHGIAELGVEGNPSAKATITHTSRPWCQLDLQLDGIDAAGNAAASRASLADTPFPMSRASAAGSQSGQGTGCQGLHRALLPCAAAMDTAPGTHAGTACAGSCRARVRGLLAVGLGMAPAGASPTGQISTAGCGPLAYDDPEPVVTAARKMLQRRGRTALCGTGPSLQAQLRANPIDQPRR